MSKRDALAAGLLIVGGLNWGAVALTESDLVARVAGGMVFGETNGVSRGVYGLVGAAALYGLASVALRVGRAAG